MTVVSLLAVLPLALASPQISLQQLIEDRQYVDRLHGVSVNLPKDWSVKVMGSLLIISDNTHFIVLRTARYDGKLKPVAQKWLEEHQLIESLRGNRARFAFKQSPQGILIVGEGLDFPHQLSPMASINAGLLGTPLPSNYQEITAFLPGQNVVLILSLYLPTTADRSVRQQMLETVRSLRLMDAKEMIPWKEHVVHDPETGEQAFRLHVPTQAEFQGTVITNAGLGTQRQPAFSMRYHDISLRLDHIGLQTSIVQSSFGGNAMCLLNINGATSQQPQPIFLSSPSDVERLIAGIWQASTQSQWSLVESMDLPKSKQEQTLENQGRQQAMQTAAVFGNNVQYSMPKRAFLYRGPDNKIRFGSWQGTLMISNKSDYIGITQDCSATFLLFTAECPESKLKTASQIFTSIMSSYQLSPQWALSALGRFTDDNRRLNQMVREMTSKHQEFNSKMATMWTNALSDQTYVKDPETNEVFKVHKRVWETGEFWREPTFGGLLGGVERGSKLEELLRLEGWRELRQSLEGFPETWKGIP
jgi:hypothetical protein